MKKRFLYDHGVNAEGGGALSNAGPGDTSDSQDVNSPTGRRPYTIGEKLAGVSFNPSKSPSVDEVKYSAAAFIDRIDEAQHRQETERIQDALFEQAKLLALQAQMLAVKAITWNG